MTSPADQQTSALQTLINGIAWTNGRGLITGAVMFSVVTAIISILVVQNAKLDTIVSISDYLATGQTLTQLTTGGIDAAPVLSAAAAAGPVTLPCGSYALNTPLSFGAGLASIRGNSPQCVTLNANFAAGDIFSFTGTQHVRFSNVTVNAAVQRTSGAVFDLIGTYDADFDEVFVSGLNGNDAWLLNNAITTHITRYECRPPVPIASVGAAINNGACLHITGSGGSQSLDVYASDGSSDSWKYGIEISNGSGSYFSDSDFVRSGVGVQFDPSSTNKPPSFGFQFSGISADTSFGDNWQIGGTGTLTDIQIQNPWASNSQGGNGFSVTNSLADQVQVTNLDALGNFGAGVVLLAGKNMSFANTSAMMDGRQNTSTSGTATPDILIGSVPDYVEFNGGRTGAGGAFKDIVGTSPTATYAVYAAGGNANGQHITVMGMQGSGHTAGFIVLPSGSNDVSTNVGNAGS